MSQVTLNRIASVLHDQFDGHIDMADWEKRPSDQAEGAFLSRALAAQCIRALARTDPKTAGAAVVDGFDDCGIDAIYFDANADTLMLVQSKWSATGKATFDEGGVSKFVNGIRTLFNGSFDRFNGKVRAKEAQIREALYASREIKIVIATVHTASQGIATHVARVIDELVSSLNDSVQIAEHLDFDQSGIYKLITAESKDPKITLQAVLNEWGVIEKPYLAYYGRVTLGQVLQWWKDHKNRLFSQNLRLFYQSSAVNDALRKTIVEDPASFWYFNNGITIISDKVIKGIAGSPAHKFGNFTCEGASVVNGAQTVGTVGNSLDPDVVNNDDQEETWVQVRLISLEKCPPEFGRRITRAANLQNAVGTREFAAMDPLQHRLATEFALDKRRYVYKSGETDPQGEEGCSIVEATQALGCVLSVSVAVQVKKEIGAIWADTEAAPYTAIFNEAVGSAEVWRAVSVMRAVEDELHRLKSSAAVKAEGVSSHMNRLILHIIHRDPRMRAAYADPASNGALVQTAREAVEPVYMRVAEYLEQHHPNDYLAVFCKNVGKCEDLVASFERPAPAPGSLHQGELFGRVRGV